MSGPHPINITPNNNEVVFNNVNNHITITNNIDHNVVEVTQPTTTIVEVNTGIVGPQGSSVVATTGSFTGSFTGSLNGTSSWSQNSISSSYALTASFALNSGGTIDTGSLVTTASFNQFTSSYNTGSFTGSFTGVFNGTSSWSNQSLTASYILLAQTASYYGGSVISSSYSATSSNSLSSSYASTASYLLNNPPPFPYTGSALITGSLILSGSAIFKGIDSGSSNYALKIDNLASTPLLYVRNDGLITISGSLQVTGSINGSFTGSLQGSSSYALTASYVANASSFPFTGSAIITGSLVVTGSANITQNLSASRAYFSASSGTEYGSIVKILGSGSTNPVFIVQGSQGELFSVIDSLSGSLFSVNDISGLPVIEVFSDNTVLIGDYQAPSLNTTKKVTANVGVTTIYSISTGSYDGAFFDYTIRSGSNSRAGQIVGMWSGSSINYTETSTADFGSTAAFTFGMSISGSNMILSGSSSTSGWTIKTIIKAI